MTLSGGERKRLVLDAAVRAPTPTCCCSTSPTTSSTSRPSAARGSASRRRARRSCVDLPRPRAARARRSRSILTLEGNGAWVHGGSYATYPRGARGRASGGSATRSSAGRTRSGACTELMKTFKERARYSLATGRRRPTRWRRAGSASPTRARRRRRSSTSRSSVRMRGGDSARRVLDARATSASTGSCAPFADEIHFGERVGADRAERQRQDATSCALLAGEAAPHERRGRASGRACRSGFFTQLNARARLRRAHACSTSSRERRPGAVERAMGALARYGLADAAPALVRRRSAAARRRGWRSSASSSRATTCCCSTSRPTTSTSTRPRRSRARSTASRARSSRSRTTARSSSGWTASCSCATTARWSACPTTAARSRPCRRPDRRRRKLSPGPQRARGTVFRPRCAAPSPAHRSPRWLLRPARRRRRRAPHATDAELARRALTRPAAAARAAAAGHAGVDVARRAHAPPGPRLRPALAQRARATCTPRSASASAAGAGGAGSRPRRADARRARQRPGAGPAAPTRVQLRGSRAASRGLRLHFVRVTGAPPAAPRVPRAAQTGQPPIVPRAQWGGDDQCTPRDAPDDRRACRWRSSTTRCRRTTTAPEDSAAMVLGICRFHRNSNGWDDIGYNFLVDKYGQVFEGRAGGIDQPVVGAQAQGWNSAVDRRREPRHVPATSRRPTRRSTRWRACSRGSCRCTACRSTGTVSLQSGGRRHEPLPGRDAAHVRAHLRPPRRQLDRRARARSSTRSCRASASWPPGARPTSSPRRRRRRRRRAADAVGVARRRSRSPSPRSSPAGSLDADAQPASAASRVRIQILTAAGLQGGRPPRSPTPTGGCTANLPTSRNRTVRALVGNVTSPPVKLRVAPALRRRAPATRVLRRAPRGARAARCGRGRARSSSRPRARSARRFVRVARAARQGRADGRFRAAVPLRAARPLPPARALRRRPAQRAAQAPTSFVRAVRSAQRGAGGPGGSMMSRPVGRMRLVELELPVVPGERHAGAVLADVRLDRARRAPSGRSARGRCGPGSAAYIGAGNAPPKRVLTSVMPSPISRSRNACTVHGPRTPSASTTRRPRSTSSGSSSTVPLIDSPPRDSSIERGIAFRQRPSVSLRQSIENSGPSMSRCTIGSLSRR